MAENRTMEELAALLLERGFDPKMLKSAKLRDVLAAQKLLLDKQKLQLQEDSMEKAFKVLMSGVIGWSAEIQEGEIVPELQDKMLEEVTTASKRKATDPVPTYVGEEPTYADTTGELPPSV